MKHLLWRKLASTGLLAGLLILAPLNVAAAAEATGKVTEVSANSVTASFAKADRVRVGNQATIALWIEGVGAIPIKGTWRVERLSGATAVLVPHSGDNDQPLAGQRVIIADTGRTVAAARKPAPTAKPPRVVKSKPRSPKETSVLSRADIRRIQQHLGILGYNAGTADGAVGRKTRGAIRAFQRDQGLSVNGHVSAGLLRSLEAAQKKTASRKEKPTADIPLSQTLFRDNRPTKVILQEAKNYYHGKNGRPVDYKKSLELARIAAHRGDSDGLYSVGVAYAFGRAVPKDMKIARGYFEQSVAKGNSRAAFNLATIYYRGFAVKKDYKKAFAYMRQAVAGEDPDTYHGMGDFYRKGIGVEASQEAAIHWYQKGARQGNRKCQKQLKKMNVAW